MQKKTTQHLPMLLKLSQRSRKLSKKPEQVWDNIQMQTKMEVLNLFSFLKDKLVMLLQFAFLEKFGTKEKNWGRNFMSRSTWLTKDLPLVEAFIWMWWTWHFTLPRKMSKDAAKRSQKLLLSSKTLSARCKKRVVHTSMLKDWMSSTMEEWSLLDQNLKKKYCNCAVSTAYLTVHTTLTFSADLHAMFTKHHYTVAPKEVTPRITLVKRRGRPAQINEKQAFVQGNWYIGATDRQILSKKWKSSTLGCLQSNHWI